MTAEQLNEIMGRQEEAEELIDRLRGDGRLEYNEYSTLIDSAHYLDWLLELLGVALRRKNRPLCYACKNFNECDKNKRIRIEICGRLEEAKE